ncbi:uncharacterized protein [Coffea arabica]|uniref:RNase H type-1 domain-containing protein n=1 Tax=Coffea arabica TaxID=13443 RepID=A0ABM4WPZ7_COFAR
MEVWGVFQRRFGILEPQPSSVSGVVSLWNRARFDGVCLEARGVVSSIASFVEQLGLANKLSKRLFRGDHEDPWARLGKRPPQFCVKLNTDGSVTQNRAYGGRLLRDSDGRLLFAFHKEFEDTDVLGAESLALLHGLRLCTGLVTGSLLVEVDSESLVHLLQAGGVSKWPLCNTLRNISGLLVSLSASISHVVREANSAADNLAGLRLASELYCTSHTQLLGQIRASIGLDSREFPFPRCRSVRG